MTLTVDRTLVTEGYPTEPGFHLLWSEHSGWPVVDLVLVEVIGDLVTWWKGNGGTDRPQELPQLFQFIYDQYLGSSRVSAEAFAHYKALRSQAWHESNT